MTKLEVPERVADECAVLVLDIAQQLDNSDSEEIYIGSDLIDEIVRLAREMNMEGQHAA